MHSALQCSARALIAGARIGKIYDIAHAAASAYTVYSAHSWMTFISAFREPVVEEYTVYVCVSRALIISGRRSVWESARF